MLGTWPCPGGDELAVSFTKNRAHSVLVLPALFEESNKLRHFTVAVMRALDASGIDAILPDFTGCNESLVPLAGQTLDSWQKQANKAAKHFSANAVLTLRGGALLDPGHLPGLRYAPVEGASVLKTMLRARVLADREAGIASERESLLEQGKRDGLRLAGYDLGAEMVAQLDVATLPRSKVVGLAQSALGGPALWLRSEPSHDAAQAETLAALLVKALG